MTTLYHDSPNVSLPYYDDPFGTRGLAGGGSAASAMRRSFGGTSASAGSHATHVSFSDLPRRADNPVCFSMSNMYVEYASVQYVVSVFMHAHCTRSDSIGGGVACMRPPGVLPIRGLELSV